MKEFFKEAWKYVLPLVIGLVIGILINIPSCHKQESKIEYIPVHDTVTVSKDRIIEHTKIKYVKDTVLYLDSIEFHDTVNNTIKLPVEYKQYLDTIKTDSTEAILQIDHHGVYSEIDSINLNYRYYKEREIIVKEPKRVGFTWCVGPQIGVGAGVNCVNGGGFAVGPYVGIGVSVGIGGYFK